VSGHDVSGHDVSGRAGSAGLPRAMFDLYAKSAKLAAVQEFQYRAGNLAQLVGFLIEPVIYLVVWRAIADTRGGTVGGYTGADLAAYYIVWTLVRNMTLVFTPYGFEWRIRDGTFSAQLLRPIHPLHYDLAYFAGWKVVTVTLWLPIAAVLVLVFRPALHPRPSEVVVFLVAIWGAYLVRSLFLWLLGLVTFWTTRVTALFELYLVVELLLSGRLVPTSLLPAWAQRLADLLPFEWTFGFPIEVLVGDMGVASLLGGLAAQALWSVIGAGLVMVVWRRAVRRHAAVGG
jgi:ABC-2 type transport system permease protein